MKRRRFGQNMPFHLKENGAKNMSEVQISPQFVICSIKSSIASLPNSIVGLEVGRLFQIGPWSRISTI